jgi:hypothetical protein
MTDTSKTQLSLIEFRSRWSMCLDFRDNQRAKGQSESGTVTGRFSLTRNFPTRLGCGLGCGTKVAPYIPRPTIRLLPIPVVESAPGLCADRYTSPTGTRTSSYSHGLTCRLIGGVPLYSTMALVLGHTLANVSERRSAPCILLVNKGQTR